MAIYRLEGEVNSDCKLIHAKETSIEYESHIEDWLENSPWALIQNETILWIDRQPSAKDEEGTIFPDLLGVDIDGNLIIVEFKRGRPPRSVVAQLLEYAAQADVLSSEEIHKIAETYFEKNNIHHGRDFNDIFLEFYDLPENEELPLLNRKLRLFIVAGEIPKRISGVCQYLRNSHGIDISCVLVSVFETETGERLVSMEAIIGDDNQPDIRPLQPDGVPTPQEWTRDKGVRDVVTDAVEDITNGDITVEFSIKDVKTLIQSKIPNFKTSNVGAEITAGCVNHPSKKHHTSAKHNYYWRIRKGIYRLYDSQNDKLEE